MSTFDPAKVFAESTFGDVVRSRRSVRRFTDTPISDEVLHACLDIAMLAPNSSNLQPWQFFVIDSPSMREAVVKCCMSQNAAKTANRLIVCVGRGDTWQQNAKDNITYYPSKPVPKAVQTYYGKLMPFAFTRGALNVLSPVKWAAIQVQRQVKGAAVAPHYTEADVKNWALISTALAAENLMLALRAYGFDSCPMGCFDEEQLSKVLGLNEHQYICMVIGAGERAEDGIYSEQYRFERERFVVTV